MRRSLLILLFLLPSWGWSSAGADVRTLWRLLDYIAVDYSGAVQGGQVISADEYAEMKSFAGTVAQGLHNLPAGAANAGLIDESAVLQKAIDDRAEPVRVAAIARGLGQRLLDAYPVPLAPRQVPDIMRGQQLYAAQCASCHGATGSGDGPVAASLNPPPIAFTDLERAKERSVFALYQVITQGLDGTAMPSFASLPDEERWALAFVAGRFAFIGEKAAEGRSLWNADSALRTAVGMEELTTWTPAAVEVQLGPDRGAAVMAYLRNSPEAVKATGSDAIAKVRERLDASLSAYRAGDMEGASRLAVSAYLDGFEPLEATLRVKDEPLMREVEAAMTALRSDIDARAGAENIARQIAAINVLLQRVDSTLNARLADAGYAFVGAFTILLREGLEALLIVVAIIAFLRKADRPQQTRYVHAGTVAALLAGILTWWVAANVIEISGAGRELTEGIAALFAAAVLVFVGIWMHNKSQAGAWQRYIQEKVGDALARRSGWFLFVLAFVVVYREVFETILFYVAMWSQGSEHAVVAGSLFAIVVLAGIAWAMLRLARRLPVSQFFTFSAVLMAILAVILTGKGVAALQEANWIPMQMLALPRLEWFGFYPSWEGLGAQLACVLVLAGAFVWNRRAATATARIVETK
ncbi:MAG: FTR1 family protein [Pseudomonadota bacterium]